MNETEEKYLSDMEMQLQQAQQSSQQQMPYSAAMFGGGQKQNLVEWELDFRNELEDIERLLRCDVLFKDKDGNEMWIENPNKEYVLFNTLGVNDITREIRMFLNKNKVLSNYGIDEIKPRIKMLGNELRSLIYNNYERYGLDNEYKWNNYPIVVLTLISMIEDTFRRAIGGEGHKGLAESRFVTQNDNAQMPPQNFNIYGGGSQKKKSIWNPFTWGR